MAPYLLSKCRVSTSKRLDLEEREKEEERDRKGGREGEWKKEDGVRNVGGRN